MKRLSQKGEIKHFERSAVQGKIQKILTFPSTR